MSENVQIEFDGIDYNVPGDQADRLLDLLTERSQQPWGSYEWQVVNTEIAEYDQYLVTSNGS